MARRGLRLTTLLVTISVLGLVGWFLIGQVQAWRHLNAGREALERNEIPKARTHLAQCLKVWPNSAEGHFLAARAARRSGDLDEADKHLSKAAQYGWVRESLDLERALWRAQMRELPAVESYLHYCLDKEHPDSLLILEILTPAYLGNFQLNQAQKVIDRWLELDPNSAVAWHHRGVLAERKQGRSITIESYSEAVRLDPERRQSRLALARVLLSFNRPAEAWPHLEELRRQSPDDPEVLVKAAACAKALGKNHEAILILDDVLNSHPKHAEAFHERGKIELERGKAKEAERYLRRAMALAPFEREVLYNALRCLQQVGSKEEVEACKQRFERVEADLRLLSDVTGKIPSDPRNADLRCQVGEIFLRNGREEDGLRWLLSALAIQADHPATHLQLANYHERKGDFLQAEQHRAKSQRKSGP